MGTVTYGYCKYVFEMKGKINNCKVNKRLFMSLESIYNYYI